MQAARAQYRSYSRRASYATTTDSSPTKSFFEKDVDDFEFPTVTSPGYDNPVSLVHGFNHIVSLDGPANKELGNRRINPFEHVDSKYAKSLHKKSAIRIVAGINSLFSDYKIRKRIKRIRLKIELCQKYYPVKAMELEDAYEYLGVLEYCREKFAAVALDLRLAVLELWFIVADSPIYFTEQRKTFFCNVWQDFEYELSRLNIHHSRTRQIFELKQKFFQRVLDELPVNRSISEIIPGGPAVVKPLCEELAYGSGAYAVQKALKQVAETEWGYEELVRLAQYPPSEEKRGRNLIIDCITLLLSFKNGFSYAMTFRIFGRLAESNRDVYMVLGGPTGIAWLVEALDKEECGTCLSPSEAGVSRAFKASRKIEMYCQALMAACTHGLVDCVVESDVVPVLLRVMQMFNERDEMVRSRVEDELQDDSDACLDQIACCELIILLMKTPFGKKLFLEGRETLDTFRNHSNRSFSYWKLSWKLNDIRRLLLNDS